LKGTGTKSTRRVKRIVDKAPASTFTQLNAQGQAIVHILAAEGYTEVLRSLFPHRSKEIDINLADKGGLTRTQLNSFYH
jgi:hypothetical protein